MSVLTQANGRFPRGRHHTPADRFVDLYIPKEGWFAHATVRALLRDRLELAFDEIASQALDRARREKRR